MERGILTVISGFSGAGKGTIMRELIQRYDYFLSVSATTRSPRAGEVDGKDYYFHTKEQFQQMINGGELIEWAEYVGNFYGTPKKHVEEQLAQGRDVLLEIEMQGGDACKGAISGCPVDFHFSAVCICFAGTAHGKGNRISGRNRKASSPRSGGSKVYERL